MGSQQTTQTRSVTFDEMGQQEASMRAVLEQLAQRGMLQLGDMSSLTSGRMDITPQDEAFIRQISALTGELQRGQAQQNYDTMSQQVEGQLLSRGLEGSSIEAVNQALLGRQLQQSLDQGALQNQITSAQQLQQQAQNRAAVQLNANQLLLNQILNSAQGLAGMSLQERLTGQTITQTAEAPFSWGAAAGRLLGSAMGNFAGPSPDNTDVGAQPVAAPTTFNPMTSSPMAPIQQYYGPSAPPMPT